MLKESLKVKTDAKADSSQIYIKDDMRVTYLTSRLIRVETGEFTDLPSYAVWYRRFKCDNMQVRENGCLTEVETADIILTIKKKKPYSVLYKDSEKTEYFSRQKNLRGTCRSLDGTFGRTVLDKGFITENGLYLFDDSKSVLLDDNGKFIVRKKKCKDRYVFAYGKDYRQTIRDFYKISSPTPLVPRFALGVWWSRYHAYTQQEYLDLIDRFLNENIPLTVVAVDMDWHWTDLKKKFGINESGWTGYSWNTDLFPDYKEFFNELKKKKLHITLNLHPADGVRSFEDMYNKMAKANKIDPDSKKKIDFKCSDDNFWNSYFDILHKPYEKDGVDFWWIDWQQGKKCDMKGLDPLKALNHFHYLDIAANGGIPLILSRYSGIGSHRYPLGFSGDTKIKWEVLNFQPYFTANAANAAYCWWSHDIGGHYQGYRNDDLYLRWIQFGVFSPVLRLHSTSNDLLGKEPWKYRYDVYINAKEWLRFRHSLIPYIFSMDYRCHNDGIALCEPMYYAYPYENNAYKVKNQYSFGSEMIVCPITSPQHKETEMGSVESWIPEGEYTDIFTGQKYEGPKMITLNRGLNSIPVLAKSGAVIPLSSDKGNSCENPVNLEVWVYKGNNTFTMYEDNGKIDCKNHVALTFFENSLNSENMSLKISVSGDLSVIPDKRKYKIIFKDIVCSDIVVKNTDANTEFDKNGCPAVMFDFKKEPVEIVIGNVGELPKQSKRDKLIEIMSGWQGSSFKKDTYYKKFGEVNDVEGLLRKLYKSKLPKAVFDAVYEAFSEK